MELCFPLPGISAVHASYFHNTLYLHPLTFNLYLIKRLNLKFALKFKQILINRDSLPVLCEDKCN